MPLHSIFILNPGGNVVFSKYFGFTNRKTTNAFKQEEKSLLFEQSVLYENTKATWTSPAISQRKLAFCDDGYIIVFQKIGELIVYVTGVEDYEEPILSETLDCVIKLLQDTVGSGALTEAVLFNPENYGKLCVCIDEMVSAEGWIESLDVDHISRLSKLKNI